LRGQRSSHGRGPVCAPRNDSDDVLANPLVKNPLVKTTVPLLVDAKKALSLVQRPPYSSAMRNILLIVLILLLIGAFPGWGYSSGWGFYPFGGLGLVLLIVLILALTGRL
jgi:hypothetical protein